MNWAYVMLYWGMFGLVVSVSLFFIGFHNLDLAWNGRMMECWYDDSLVDHAIDGEFYSMDDGIRIGAKMMLVGLAGVFFGALLFGRGLARVDYS